MASKPENRRPRPHRPSRKGWAGPRVTPAADGDGWVLQTPEGFNVPFTAEDLPRPVDAMADPTRLLPMNVTFNETWPSYIPDVTNPFDRALHRNK